MPCSAQFPILILGLESRTNHPSDLKRGREGDFDGEYPDRFDLCTSRVERNNLTIRPFYDGLPAGLSGSPRNSKPGGGGGLAHRLVQLLLAEAGVWQEGEASSSACCRCWRDSDGVDCGRFVRCGFVEV